MEVTGKTSKGQLTSIAISKVLMTDFSLMKTLKISSNLFPSASQPMKVSGRSFYRDISKNRPSQTNQADPGQDNLIESHLNTDSNNYIKTTNMKDQTESVTGIMLTSTISFMISEKTKNSKIQEDTKCTTKISLLMTNYKTTKSPSQTIGNSSLLSPRNKDQSQDIQSEAELQI